MHQGEKLKEIVEAYCAKHSILIGSIHNKLGLKQRTGLYKQFEKKTIKPDIIVKLEAYTGNAYMKEFYPNLYKENNKIVKVEESKAAYNTKEVAALKKRISALEKEKATAEINIQKQLSEIHNQFTQVNAKIKKLSTSANQPSLDRGKGA